MVIESIRKTCRKECVLFTVASFVLICLSVLAIFDTPQVKFEKMPEFDLKTFTSTAKYETVRSPSIYLRQLNKSYQIQVDQILRDSINIIHLKNFIKPTNETCVKRPPSCIIIGVSKCGTRELIDFMRLHPHIQIYMNKRSYEMHYFSSSKSNGTKALEKQAPCCYSNQITVMKHSGYFHMKTVPERIQHFNKRIKLILLVREPIARMQSALSFNSHIQSDQLPRRIVYDNCTLIKDQKEMRKSVYDESMELWLQYFNLSQFLIIESNELKYDPVLVLNKVEKFLGLGHFITSEMFVFNKEKGFFCIKSNLTSTGMACYTGNRGRNHVSLPKNITSKLTEYFQPKNKNFFNLIGRSYNW